MTREVVTAGRTRMTVLPAKDHAVLAGLAQEITGLLRRDGAILIRGLGLSTPDEFHAAVSVFGDPMTSYKGGNTPRQNVSAGVFTSTDYPPQYEISLHNELSYAHMWPAQLYFASLATADTGGATPVCDGRGLLDSLKDGVRERFTGKGVSYHQYLHGGYGFGKSWQATFETSDRNVVDSFLADAGAQASWTDDDALRVTLHRPSTRRHPETAEEVWFNQADQWHPANLPEEEASVLLSVIDSENDLPHHATFGDGSPITAADLGEIREAAQAHKLVMPWQQGDLMIIDNMLVLHGREPFTGTRRVVVSMT